MRLAQRFRLDVQTARDQIDDARRAVENAKNGLLPVVLTEQQVDKLFNETFAFNGFKLTIDLERKVVLTGDGTEYPFEVPGLRKFCLLNGFDDIGLTLRHADKIHQFENERLIKQPWLNNRLVG